MAITDSLILAKDVVLTPVADLPAHLREQITYDDGDYAITRPRSRTPSSIIDTQAADLLQRFREPSTVVEAVLHFSRSRDADPTQTLEDAYPLIQRLLHARLLVAAGSEEAGQIEARFAPGDSVAGWDVVRCVQVLEDAELYQVRREGDGEAALKILRPGAGELVERALRREAALLRHLDGGGVSPRLRDEGRGEDGAFLVMDWCPGVPADAAAARRRRDDGAGAVRALAGAILAAYAGLHARGVVHSDIHPRNILVADDGGVQIIDFGWARLPGNAGSLGRAERAGVAFFYEPELAQARRRHAHPPPASFAGEQYALGALLYLLLTGSHYQDFSLEKHEMLRQIAEDGPRPFADAGASPWPAGERLLARSLHKDPAQRFPSVAAWAAAWKAALTAEASDDSGPPDSDPAPATDLLDRVLARIGPGGALTESGLTTAPFCSVNNGAAGLAYALYRMAMARDEAPLLSAADLWATRALGASGGEGAFVNPALDLTAEMIGAVTPYHTASGVHAVRALIAQAMGDFVSAQNAVNAFLAAISAPCATLDITLGRSGALLGCCLLREALPDHPLLDRRPLCDAGDALLAGIWAELDAYAPIADCGEITFLGIAHGWAGLAYAAMRWCRAAGTPLPATLPTRLGQLVDLAEPSGPGARWKRTTRSRGGDYWSGWCNGTAGFVHLWTLAHRVFGDESYGRLAEQAARHSWEADEAVGDLCCGLAGRAYALLALSRHTGEAVWRRRAQHLGAQAARHIGGAVLPHSLYKGDPGVAVLVADLSCPETAAMPFFEPEGWPARPEPSSPASPAAF